MNTTNNIWGRIKKRYRLASFVQMSFELSMPQFLIGKCRVTGENGSAIKTKKISLSPKGIVLSDTIPLSWFTSSVLLPWEKILDIDLPDTASTEPHCTLRLNDPFEMVIDLPWSNAFTAYAHRY